MQTGQNKLKKCHLLKKMNKIESHFVTFKASELTGLFRVSLIYCFYHLMVHQSYGTGPVTCATSQVRARTMSVSFYLYSLSRTVVSIRSLIPFISGLYFLVTGNGQNNSSKRLTRTTFKATSLPTAFTESGGFLHK